MSKGTAKALWYVGIGLIIGFFLIAPLWAKALAAGVIIMSLTEGYLAGP